MSQSYPPNPNEPQRDPAGGDGPPAAEPGQPPRQQEPPRQPPQQQGPPPHQQGQQPYGPGQQGPPSYGPGQPQQGQQGFPPPSQQRPGAYPGYGPPPTQQYPTAPPTQQWPPQQQGPAWGGPGGGGGGGAIYGGSPSAAKTFFPKLFDLSFREFITPSVIKVLYVLAMIGVVFAWLGLAISGFRSSVGLGLFLLLIIGPLYALFLLILLRVTMEFYVAVIRVAEDVRELKKGRPSA